MGGYAVAQSRAFQINKHLLLRRSDVGRAAYPFLDQSLPHHIRAADGDALEIPDLHGSLEIPHIRVIRCGRDEDGVVRVEHFLEKLRRLRLSAEAVMRLIHHHADAQPFGT